MKGTWYALVLSLAMICTPWVIQGGRQVLSGPISAVFLFLCLAIWLGLNRTVRLSTGDYHSVYTLDDAPTFAILFLFPTPVATFAVSSMRLLHELIRLAKGLRYHRDKVTAAHVASYMADMVFVGFATLLTGTGLDYLGRPNPLTTLKGAASALLAGCLWFIILFLLHGVHLTMVRGTPGTWWRQSVASLRENLATVALFLPMGILMSVFLREQVWLVPLLFVPVSLIHTVMEASQKLENETQQTILALSTYLEERDGYTSGHSRRVAGYAAAIAAEVGLSPSEIQTAHRAGLIHDLGKIDVPDAVLRKPGMLTDEERAIMRTHTDRAVELGEKLVALKDGLPFKIAAYHHENYDGTGHFGLKGADIPLVSRMLAVADTFDAMTSDRPYRDGMDDSEAILRLKAASGTQLDPALVTAFLRVYDKGEIDIVRDEFPALGSSSE